LKTTVTSSNKEVIIGDGQPTTLIGERINPTGRKKFAEALKTGNIQLICDEAVAQAEAGADIIDVNVSTVGVDEVAVLPEVVKEIMKAIDIPLCLDCANPKALEAALKIYKGKPLINSVTGEEHSLKSIIPLAKEYNAALVGLVQDDHGVPDNAEKRLAIALNIIEQAEKAGIQRGDIIIDCLALAAGADSKACAVTLETISRVRSTIGVNTVVAGSNVSFGLPDRQLLNNSFVTLTINAGINCLILDVSKIRPAVLAADLLLNHDSYGKRYIKDFRNRNANKA